MDIVIDFDGTVVKHVFPEIGESIGAEEVLKELVEAGHNLILFTMRSNNGDLPLFKEEGIVTVNGDYLNHAVQWFESKGIKLHGIQTNPTQSKWTTSPKAYGQIIIDDAALGCPLIFPENERPYVDWKSVRDYFSKKGLLK